MTVGDLIEALEALDPDLPVLVQDCEWGLGRAHGVIVQAQSLRYFEADAPDEERQFAVIEQTDPQ